MSISNATTGGCRRFCRAVWCAVGLSFVAGCGGGGGSAQDNLVSASFNVPEVSATVIEGGTSPLDTTVVATIKYSGSRDIFLGSVEDQGLLTDYGIVVAQPKVTINMRFKLGRTAGTYTSQLKLRACFDQACREEVPGSPMLLPLKLVVTPNLKVQPTLELTRTGRDAAPVGTATVTVPPNAGTLSITSVGAGNDAFDVQLQGNVLQVTTRQVRAGRYTGRVELAASGNNVYRTGIDVIYVVNPPAGGELGLSASPAVPVSVSVAQGKVFTARIRVQQPTWTTERWRPVPNTTYQTNAVSSLVDLGNDEYEVRLETNNLAPGTSETLSIAFEGSSNYNGNLGARPVWYLQITEAFGVGPGLAVTFDATTRADALRLSAPVNVYSGPPQRWTARLIFPGLRLLRTTGITGIDPVEVEIDRDDAISGRFGSAPILLSIDRAGTNEIVATVYAQQRLPKLGQVLNETRLQGSGVIYAAGQFPFASQWEKCLQVTGATLRTATLVTPERENIVENVLRLEFDSAAAGQDIVVRCNAPLLTTQVRTPVAAVLRVPPGYVSLPFKDWRPPQFSLTRGALFFAGDGVVARWSLGASSWTLNTLSVPGLLDVAPFGDHSVLIGIGGADAWRIGSQSLGVEVRQTLPSINGFSGIEFQSPAPATRGLAFSIGGAALANVRPKGYEGPAYRFPFFVSGHLGELTLSFANQSDSFGDFDLADGVGSTSGVIRSPNGQVLVGQFPSGKIRIQDSSLQGSRTWGALPGGVWARAVSDDGVRLLRSDGLMQINGTVVAGSLASRLPAGFAVGGYGLTGKGNHALVYGYRISSEASGPRARDAALWVFDVSAAATQGIAAAPLLDQLPLTDAVGCTAPLQVAETCAHVATVTVAEGDQSVFVLGPRGVAALPLPAAVVASSAPAAQLAARRGLVPGGVIKGIGSR
jgi:hypothetical protein